MTAIAAAPSKQDARALRDTEVAKLIRAELKAAFPKTKFSVRSSSSIYVRYVDGPTTGRVEAIVSKFEGKVFNAMDDSTSYKPPFLYNGEWVYTYCYIFVQRELSPKFMDRLVMAVATYYGVSNPAVVAGFVRPTFAEQQEFHARTGLDWGTAIYRASRDRSSVCRAQN